MNSARRLCRVPLAVALVASLLLVWGGSADAKHRPGLSSPTFGNAASQEPDLSADGKVMTFISFASNLIQPSGLSGVVTPTDTNGTNDVFVSDGLQTILVTYDYDNNQAANGPSESPSISNDGRYVAFASRATNLGVPDANGAVEDIFKFDLKSRTMSLISVKTNGVAGNNDSDQPSISADGRYVAFRSYATNLVNSDANGKTDIFLADTSLHTVSRVSVTSSGGEANGDSSFPALSGDGTVVAFQSAARNLIGSNQDGNGVVDVFTHSMTTGNTKRVSVTNSGAEANGRSEAAALSSDGQVVAFASLATNLIGQGDTNGFQDVFVRNRSAGTTVRASSLNSLQGDGASFDPSISADGRFVVFSTYATWGVDPYSYADVWEKDLTGGGLQRMSSPASADTSGAPWLDADSNQPAISDNGYVSAFTTLASNVVAPPKPPVSDVATHEFADQPNRSGCILTLFSIALFSSAVYFSFSNDSPTSSDRCDEAGELGQADTTQDPIVIHVTSSTADIFSNITALGGITTWLRYGVWNGSRGWGFNKIVSKHGWGPIVKGQVQGIFANPTLVAQQGSAFAVYGTYFSSFWGQTCSRKIIVETSTGPISGILVGNTAPGIITTYAKLGTRTDF